MDGQWHTTGARLMWVDLSKPEHASVWVEPRAIVAFTEGNDGDAVVILSNGDHFTIYDRSASEVLLHLMEKLRAAGL